MTIAAAGPEYVWFLDTLVRVRITYTGNTDGLSALEHQAPFGNSPPLHIHRSEDEVFHNLDSEFRIGDEEAHFGPSLLVGVAFVPRRSDR